METVITIVCSNCNKTLKVVEGKGVSGISHGICPDCVPIVYGDFFTKQELEEILREEAYESSALNGMVGLSE